MGKRLVSLSLAFLLLVQPFVPCAAASKVKIRGYITSKPDGQTLRILDDQVSLGTGPRFELQNPGPAGAPRGLDDLALGMLIEVEGRWAAKHRFVAEKITCDANQFDKDLKEHAYLETEPEDAEAIASGKPARLRADGETLLLDEKTKRTWASDVPLIQTAALKNQGASLRFVGRQVQYSGVRTPTGEIAAGNVELGPPAPSDAYKIPGGIVVARAREKQTGIDILEFRKGDKVRGRMKLFAVKEVQQYVTDLGDKLLPSSADVTARALEFRFYVVEDPSINAAALPDGTIFVNTGLLGAVENESQLAFVLSHEIAHVLQAHHWREVEETRSKRVMLIIAAVAGAYFIGNLGVFLSELGLEAVVNGYSRRVENQADRLGLQNVINHGYDPRSSVTFFRTMIEHYGGRSTSALWSSHDSSLLRGSFLTVQLAKQYPQGHFDAAVVDTERFRSMKETMGPVKIM